MAALYVQHGPAFSDSECLGLMELPTLLSSECDKPLRVANELSSAGKRKRKQAPVYVATSGSETEVEEVKDTADDSLRNKMRFVDLRRNPNGVGAFCGGKFHWREARYPNACGRVGSEPLSEELRVATDNIEYEEHVGFVVQHAFGRYEVCHFCCQNLRRAGCLSET